MASRRCDIDLRVVGRTRCLMTRTWSCDSLKSTRHVVMTTNRAAVAIVHRTLVSANGPGASAWATLVHRDRDHAKVSPIPSCNGAVAAGARPFPLAATHEGGFE